MYIYIYIYIMYYIYIYISHEPAQELKPADFDQRAKELRRNYGYLHCTLLSILIVRVLSISL